MAHFELDAKMSPLEEASGNIPDQVLVRLAFKVFHQALQAIQILSLFTISSHMTRCNPKETGTFRWTGDICLV
jgi:hypothetical protein